MGGEAVGENPLRESDGYDRECDRSRDHEGSKEPFLIGERPDDHYRNYARWEERDLQRQRSPRDRFGGLFDQSLKFRDVERLSALRAAGFGEAGEVVVAVLAKQALRIECEVDRRIGHFAHHS